MYFGIHSAWDGYSVTIVLKEMTHKKVLSKNISVAQLQNAVCPKIRKNEILISLDSSVTRL